MNKQKKVDFKKTLVRTNEKPITKAKVIVEDSRKSSSENVTLPKKAEKPIERRRELSETNLDLPELYSTLRISKKIDDVVKPRKTKSCSDVDKKLAVDEKVSRKVNFPYDQPIYKGLIPLTCSKVQTRHIPSRAPLPQRDKEPVLSDFLIPREPKQYYYTPKIKIETNPTIVSCDNLRLYRILQKYD